LIVKDKLFKPVLQTFKYTILKLNYGCMLCIFLFDSVSYVFFLLCLCILIDMYPD